MLNPTNDSDRDSRGPVDPDGILPSLAELSLACIHREYPYAWIQVITSDNDLGLPRERTPAFCGSFDWHSSVHTHWTLLRIARWLPDSGIAVRAIAALGRSLTPENLAAELEFAKPRPGFERPYGLAWLFTLHAEATLAPEIPAAADWMRGLAPLVRLGRDRFLEWIFKLPFPIRSGEHSQTAFAMGLAIDAAEITQDEELREGTATRARQFYGSDRDAPLAYEPSGHDFLSPAIAEADLLRRALSPDEFSSWLDAFWPTLAAGEGLPLQPVTTPDRSDGKLAHLDGLNLSRAWMLEAIGEALPPVDPRREALERLSARHAELGLGSADGQFYEGGHWLASFAAYLVTKGFRAEPRSVA